VTTYDLVVERIVDIGHIIVGEGRGLLDPAGHFIPGIREDVHC